jgi:hypothetical protein
MWVCMLLLSDSAWFKSLMLYFHQEFMQFWPMLLSGQAFATE